MTETFGKSFGVYSEVINENTAQTKITIEERHLNARGTMHGGMTATILDNTCGEIAGNGPRATISLTINYLAPGLLGDELTCTAHLDRQTKTLAFVHSNMVNQNGTTIATATAVFRIMNKK